MSNPYYRPPHFYSQGSIPAYTGQNFVPQPSGSKAIPIVDPHTSKVINLNKENNKENNTGDDSSNSYHANSEEKPFKILTSRPVKIVDPNAKNEDLNDKEEKKDNVVAVENKSVAENDENKENEEKVISKEEQPKEEPKVEANEEQPKTEPNTEHKDERKELATEEGEDDVKEEAKHEQTTADKKEGDTQKKEEDESKDEKKESEPLTAKSEEETSMMAKGLPLGRLDLSAIPAHVYSESPVTTPTSLSPPRVKKPPMPVIDDFSTINYPPDFLAPKGRDPETGRIAYDRNFMMQFEKLCYEVNDDPAVLFKDILEAKARDNATGGPGGGGRGGRGGGGSSRRQASERGGRGARTPDSMSRSNSRDSRGGEMGKFAGGRPISHRQGSSGPNSPSMERQGSHGGRGRGGRGGKSRHGSRDPNNGGPTIPLDQVVPLEKSENRWVPTVVATSGTAATASENLQKEAEDMIPQEVIVRKVKALLNKLTLEKFDSISDQIWEFAKQSEKEEDGKSLRCVIELVFHKACDEPNFARMWAALCKKMFDTIQSNTEIKDVNILNNKGEVVTGGPLYRKYLLNRCQAEFEKGWKSDLPKFDESNPDLMMTDEYYAAVKAKRQGLGLVQFIGELFKLGMLSDRVMIECLRRLCANPQAPEDEETETMCKLLTTIGRVFDTSSRKNKEWLDAYFGRMQEMYESSTLSSRVKFMILDVFDLRKNKWMPKNGAVAPTTIAQIHEQAKKAKEVKEKEMMKRSSSSRGGAGGGGQPMSRQGSRAGDRGMPGSRDISRQNSARGSPTLGMKSRSNASNSVLGPATSPFSSLSRSASKNNLDKKPPTAPEPAPTAMSNMFSALGGDDEEEDEHEKAEDSKEAEVKEDNNKAESAVAAVEKEEDKPKESDEVIERRSKNTIDEYFSIRDKTELCECVKELDHPHYRVIFARKLLDVVEKKTSDVEIVCDMIELLMKEKALLTREQFVEAFKQFWDVYEDLVIDVPQAPKHVDMILAITGIERSEVETSQ
ncbi:armadillo-type protein [Mycotypha africana]|uniref:armadillo-type protein n=1 Tax=Mycotypha africana TaxID=64632 RepID=UPI0022FFEE0D|nr:armadillo-type protein [Mycotypha africana]KAI8984091.1 armadillo-type protein [Mycotypha africana]